MKRFILLFLVMAAVCAVNVSAIDVVIGETDHTEAGTINDDYMFMGKGLSFSGGVEDLFFFGQSLDFSGTSKNSTYAFGETIVIDGQVGNDLFATGETVTINRNVEGTVFAAGSTVIISDETKISGTVFAAGAAVIIKGDIKGDLYVAGATIRLEGVVEGDVKMGAGNVYFTDDALIKGNLHYSTENKLSESTLSHVKGDVTFNPIDKDGFFKSTDWKENLKTFEIIFKVVASLSFILAGLLLFLLPVFKKAIWKRENKPFWMTSVWGLIPYFVFPVAIVLLFVLGIFFGITIPIAIMMLLVYAPVLLLSQLLGAALMGTYIANLVGWEKTNLHVNFLIGAASFIVLSQLPFIGFLAGILFSVLGFGMIIEGLFSSEPTPAESE